MRVTYSNLALERGGGGVIFREGLKVTNILAKYFLLFLLLAQFLKLEFFPLTFGTISSVSGYNLISEAVREIRLYR